MIAVTLLEGNVVTGQQCVVIWHTETNRGCQQKCATYEETPTNALMITYVVY
jgi:hypothetical protein